MKLKIKMVVCVVISLIILSSKVTAEAPTYEIVVKIETPQDYIIKYAEQFDTNPELLLKIANCESQFNPEAKGDKKDGVYLAVGLYQYHLDMWNGSVELYKKEVADENLSRDSFQDQAKITAFIFAKHPELRKKWTSYVAYINGGTYSFYSKLLGKHYTVVCK